jgi:hypothetical protein
LDRVAATHGTDTSAIGNLATRFFGTDERLYDVYMMRTLVAAVARVRNPGCKMDTVTLLTGTQGVGKSTWWAILAGAWFDDSLGGAGDRDERMKLHAAWILEWAELSALKPTLAILTEQACSAAYLLAAQARQIVLPDTGYAGSIGVIMLHANMAGALDREGVDITILHAGARKADFNPYQALPADVRDEEIADMELVRQMFAASVADGRGPRMNAAAALATEARTYRGAAAVAAGLCDAVAWPRAAKQAFIDAMNE